MTAASARRAVRIGLALWGWLCAAEALAQVPTWTGFVGRPTNEAWEPLSEARTFTFQVFGASEGGRQLWGPDTRLQEVTDGMVSLQLGDGGV
ncbi:MAG: hypothetical protein HY901_15840 [Deltaproteobacteria bacterium]|nr:hypothetical protein [Deltaproteobacteria bacterium]